jgi:hypothetical protein
VTGSQWNLIHPANDARKELKGCIAPVSVLTSPGKGLRSRLAFQRLKTLVFEALEQQETVLITIQTKRNESAFTTGKSAHS